jgi:hypothetical protein
LTKFFSGKNNVKVTKVSASKVISGNKRHPLSLLKDNSIQNKKIEGNESIFDIIMPWKEEIEKEEKKKDPKKGGKWKSNQSMK